MADDTTVTSVLRSDYGDHDVIGSGGWVLAPLDTSSEQPKRHFQNITELIAYALLESPLQYFIRDNLKVLGIDCQAVDGARPFEMDPNLLVEEHVLPGQTRPTVFGPKLPRTEAAMADQGIPPLTHRALLVEAYIEKEREQGLSELAQGKVPDILGSVARIAALAGAGADADVPAVPPFEPDPGVFDLDFRPPTYWPDLPNEQTVLAQVKGTVRQEIARQLLEGEHAPTAEDLDFVLDEQLDDEAREQWGRLDPQMLGGEFLPDYLEGEVEIARIVLASVTGDVFQLRARRDSGLICYRIVDEYEDQRGPDETYLLTPSSSRAPLSLRELIWLVSTMRFPGGLSVDDAQSDIGLIETVLRRNLDGRADAEEMRVFFSGSSAFYRQFADYVRARMEHWYAGLGSGEYPGWEAEVREEARRRPDDPDAHDELMLVLLLSGDTVGAEAECREVIRLRPDDPDAHRKLGVVLEASGDTAGAEAAYREGIRLQPGRPEAHYNLGKVLVARADTASAEAEYREAIRLRPDYAEAQRALETLLASGTSEPEDLLRPGHSEPPPPADGALPSEGS
jgi:hypothetical protein